MSISTSRSHIVAFFVVVCFSFYILLPYYSRQLSPFSAFASYILFLFQFLCALFLFFFLFLYVESFNFEYFRFGFVIHFYKLMPSLFFLSLRVYIAGELFFRYENSQFNQQSFVQRFNNNKYSEINYFISWNRLSEISFSFFSFVSTTFIAFFFGRSRSPPPTTAWNRCWIFSKWDTHSRCLKWWKISRPF